ncbi:MAG TPA: hypothetical protein VIY08_10425 [Candidatus Nitrosocosmicus sp.]
MSIEDSDDDFIETIDGYTPASEQQSSDDNDFDIYTSEKRKIEKKSKYLKYKRD